MIDACSISEWIAIATTVVALVSELMGVSSTGPNGIVDSVRHTLMCIQDHIRSRAVPASPLGEVDE